MKADSVYLPSIQSQRPSPLIKHSVATVHIRTSKSGFTLVELLVAISIFAILAAMGWKVFDHLNKVKERNIVHETNLSKLQDAYLQMQRDTLQIMPINAAVESDVEPALSLNDARLSFTKSGVTDPLKQGFSPYERIEYQYSAQDKKIYRLKYTELYRVSSTQPLSSVLLDDVENYEVIVLNPAELSQWPDPSIDNNNQKLKAVLPRGVRIQFSKGGVQYEWLFSLMNTDYLAQSATSSASGQSSSEPVAGQGQSVGQGFSQQSQTIP